MSLVPPETVGKLQKALHGKAKESPDFRFYTLYDKIYRPDVLLYAYRKSQMPRQRRERKKGRRK